MAERTDPLVLEAALREVEYTRHDFHNDPERVTASLLAFIYDVPYLAACGVFPPLHLLNERLRSGGEEGGMSPGATWKPFELSKIEYDQLLAAIDGVPIEQVRINARFAHLPYKRDLSFDHYQSYMAWLTAACNKHRAAWHEEMRRTGFMR